MSDLDDLYQEVILDHNKSPRNFRAMKDATRSADGYNPLCGDQVRVYLSLEGDVIRDISFLGSGCAISKASASMMTSILKGKTEAEARSLFEKVHQMLTDEVEPPQIGGDLAKLAILSGVRKFPARVKCASLAWHTFNAALNDTETATSTE